MSASSSVLIADKHGNGKEWVDHETAVCYIVREKVVWTLGNVINTFRGGKNSYGMISQVDIHSILGVSGPLLGKRFYQRVSHYAERTILYHRDLFLCAYCGEKFTDSKLTIDHVTPKSKGGDNTWMNCVTACKPCNLEKADNRPEEVRTLLHPKGMPLLYLPYAPNSQEKIIMKRRNILVDQMEFLMARVPKHSRLWKIYQQ